MDSLAAASARRLTRAEKKAQRLRKKQADDRERARAAFGGREVQEESAAQEESEVEGSADASEASFADGSEEEASEASAEAGDDVADEEHDQVSSRTRPRHVPSAKDVRVEAPKRYHASWKEWFEYHEDYCEATLQVLPISEAMSRENRNGRILKTKAGKAGTAVLVPPEWDMYQRTYICTYGWTDKPRGKGVRPHQHIRSQGCPFRFVVQAAPDRQGKWRLVVKHGLFVHNHEITQETHATLPPARGIVSPIAEAHVAGMLAAGAKRSTIYDYLLDNNENVIQRDIDNLVQTSKISMDDDNDATAAEVAKFAAESDGNVVSIDETAMHELGVLSLTTEGMRSVYARFPELLFVDCTHKTNRYNYQLMTFMTMNEFGEGMPVQHSLIEANGDWHMDRAIEHFKRANSDKWKLLRVILVDKDLNEIKILKSHFPEARILICYFHVKKYLKEMITKPDFGRISVDDAASVFFIVEKMIKAADDAVYEDQRAALRNTCNRVNCPGFFEYMDRNWHKCLDMWLLHRRACLPHFRNNTNNMLESWFGKFKDSVKKDMSMATCVKELVASARRMENEYKYRHNRLGTLVHRGYDKEMSQVLRFTTHFVADEIQPEYAAGVLAADTNLYTFVVNEAEQTVAVQGPQNTHRLNLMDWRCTCTFACEMLLPCRHMIAYRKQSNAQGPVIPWERIDERWTSQRAALQPARRFEYHVFDEAVARQESKKRKARTQTQRYKEAVRATHLIANELADISDEEEFDTMLTFVLTQWRNVRQRKMEPVQEPVQDAPAAAFVDTKPDEEMDDDDGDMLPTQPAMPVDLSQPHSLWSEEMGDITPVDPTVVKFSPLVHLSQDLHQAMPADPTVVKSSPADRKMTGEEIMKMKIEGSTKEQLSDSSESDVDEVTGSGDSRVTSAVAASLQIKINPKARKSGRPKIDKKQKAVDEALERVRFNAAQTTRQEFRVDTLQQFADKLDADQPGLEEARRLLSSLTVKFTKDAGKRPKYEVQRNPVCNLDAFYLLPPTLLDAALAKFPLGNNHDQPIVVATPPRTPPQQLAPAAPTDKPVEVVVIKDVGIFSRVQIESMKRLQVMKELVEEGLEVCKWLRQTVAPGVPANMQEIVLTTADNIMKTYPSARLPNLDGDEYRFAILYRALPPTYLNDAIIRAACLRMQVKFPSVRYADTPPARPKTARGKAHATPATLHIRVAKLANAEGVETVLLPVNFGNAHWCGIVVRVAEKRVLYYDPLNQATYKDSLDQMAHSLVSNALPGFTVAALNSPIQFDAYSCGVFVVWMFYRQVDKTAPKDMSGPSLTRRRFELFYFVLTGTPPTEIVPAIEPPPPAAAPEITPVPAAQHEAHEIHAGNDAAVPYADLPDTAPTASKTAHDTKPPTSEAASDTTPPTLESGPPHSDTAPPS